MKSLPFVSVIVMCRNEKAFIAACLDSLIANDYPKDQLELLVVDGMSEDGTWEIVASYSATHPFLKLLDNPRKIPAAAANRGIKASKGSLILIAGAHATYPTEYISKCVRHSLLNESADNVGGVRLTEPRSQTILARSVAYVSSHRLGAGTATYHRGGKSPRWVKSVWGGCFRREVFERIGLFNEALSTGEDRELNHRLRRSGGKILLAPDIQCTYYARGSLGDYFRWLLRMGFWPFYASKVSRQKLLSLRNFAPLAFVISLVLALGLAMWMPLGRFLVAGILACHLLVSLCCSARLSAQQHDARYLIATPLLFAATHLLYGVGSVYGVLKAIVKSSASAADPTSPPPQPQQEWH